MDEAMIALAIRGPRKEGGIFLEGPGNDSPYQGALENSKAYH